VTDVIETIDATDDAGPSAAPPSPLPVAPAVTVAPREFAGLVEAEALGVASPAQRALLEADEAQWRLVLTRLLHETEGALDTVRALTTPEREQVVADFESEADTLRTALRRLAGPPVVFTSPFDEVIDEGPPVVRLQASWSPGRVVVWAAGPHTEADSYDELRERLRAAGAPAAPWLPHGPVGLPDDAFADALAAPVGDVLGWLVAIGAEPPVPPSTAPTRSIPPTPRTTSRTSPPACAGWVGSRCGRSSSRCTAPWCRCSASASAAATAPTSPSAPTPCVGPLPWSTPPACGPWPRPCLVPSPPSMPR
jgi:hypothetical protein